MKKLSGVITALPTPFLENGALDVDALKKFVDFQIENGVSALLPVGTTGESPTLSHDEHAEVIRIVVDRAAERVPVICGTGSNSTAEAVALTKQAADDGAAYSLQVTPYYNKPSQEGLFRRDYPTLSLKRFCNNCSCMVIDQGFYGIEIIVLGVYNPREHRSKAFVVFLLPRHRYRTVRPSME